MRRSFLHDRSILLAASMLTTFAVVRAWLHVRPDTDLTVGPYNVHHLFTGVVILSVCGIPAVLRTARGVASRVLVAGFGVGLALVLDEWLYLIVTDGSNAAYVRMPSLMGGAALVGAASAYALWLRREGSDLDSYDELAARRDDRDLTPSN